MFKKNKPVEVEITDAQTEKEKIQRIIQERETNHHLIIKSLIVLFILASFSLVALMVWNSHNEKLQDSYQSNFYESEQFNQKVYYYNKLDDINQIFLLPRNKNIINNNLHNMKQYFVTYYETNINANDIDTTNYNGTNDKKIQSLKSAYQNLINLQELIKKDKSLSSAMRTNLNNKVDKAITNIRKQISEG